VQAGESVTVEVEGQTVDLLPEELEVRTEAREGYAVAEEAGYLAAVSTTLDEGLIQEGLARELVRRIQTMRKEAGFHIEDRIITYYQADLPLQEVLEALGEYIKGETLSTELIEGDLAALMGEGLPTEPHVQTFEIEGEEISLGLVLKE